MTTVLTREYLDARPDGWLDYAAKRIAQLYVHFKLFFLFFYLQFLSLSQKTFKYCFSSILFS